MVQLLRSVMEPAPAGFVPSGCVDVKSWLFAKSRVTTSKSMLPESSMRRKMLGSAGDPSTKGASDRFKSAARGAWLSPTLARMSAVAANVYRFLRCFMAIGLLSFGVLHAVASR